ALGKAGNLIAAGKIAGMMGCAVKRLGADIFKKLPHLSFAVGPRAFGLIPKIVAEGRFPALELGDGLVPCGLDAHVEQSGFQAYVTIMTGCDNRCSYCIVPDVRGREYARPENEILAEAGSLAKNGVREICLLGQSVLRYPGFPALLRRLAAIDGIERIRFTSAHPKGCTDELVAVFRECPQVCRHMHLPVQSGSGRILEAMGRRYTREEYLAAVRKLREFDPEFAVTSDVIVGYPGETEADFEDTRSLMEEAGFDNAFVFKYSPRPGTRSAALPDDVPKAEKERRNGILLADQERRGLRRNEALVGTVREVLCEGVSKRNRERLAGRDGGNRIVVWSSAQNVPAGSKVSVRIVEAHAQILVGEKV
ncbi:MAG: MiaB/RimO family radical SAM methylthiotransferase, partial [Kiritimatiellae bacterium]|nr:MiaB/RimO family radical SAM methylthiotransferase [Kiritimatiellia bacterium]